MRNQQVRARGQVDSVQGLLCVARGVESRDAPHHITSTQVHDLQRKTNVAFPLNRLYPFSKSESTPIAL